MSVNKPSSPAKLDVSKGSGVLPEGAVTQPHSVHLIVMFQTRQHAIAQLFSRAVSIHGALWVTCEGNTGLEAHRLQSPGARACMHSHPVTY